MCRVFEDLIDDIREGGNNLYAYKNLNDIVAKEWDNQYTLQEKIFEAKISQSILLPIEKIS